jgi:Leucine-rich repeat (LRR) protein
MCGARRAYKIVFNQEISTNKGVPVPTSPKSGEKTPDQQQLPVQKAETEPQDAIATAQTSDASDLTLSGDDFSDLTVLPPDICTLTTLTDLSLSGTQVSDISALSGLTGLMELTLTGTPVNDLSPILPLTQLVDAPKYGGLAFKNTAAAQADIRIAEIARIQDDAKRATDLCAYLRNVTPT